MEVSPDPILSVIRVIMQYLKTLGSDDGERRLLEKAQACRDLAAALSGLDTSPKPVTRLAAAQWSGAAARAFHERRREHLDEKKREGVVRDLRSVADDLERAALQTRQTRESIKQLALSLLEAWVAGKILAAALAGIGAWAGWAASMKRDLEIAARGMTATTTLVQRFRVAAEGLSHAMRLAAVSVGRSNALRAMTLKGTQAMAFGQTYRIALGKYWKLFRWGMGGSYLAGMAGRTVSGQNPFTLSTLGLAEMVNSAWISALTGPIGGTVGMAAMKKWKAGAILGLGAGASYAAWNAKVEGKSWGQAAQDAALLGSISAAWTGAVGRALKGDALIKSNALGLLPASIVRSPWVLPFAPPSEQVNLQYRKLDDPAPLPGPAGGGDVDVTPWATPYSALWKIAVEKYGDGRLWPAIYDANRDLIGEDPDLLHVGDRLIIPKLKL